MKNLIERFRDRLAEFLQNVVDRIDPAPAEDARLDCEAMDSLRSWLWADLSEADRLVAWAYTPALAVVAVALQKAEREGLRGWAKHREARHG